MADLLLIPCGAKKHDHAAPAASLYTGSLFRAGLNAADRAGMEVRIVSAKHGLLKRTDIVEPYEQKMTPYISRTIATKMGDQAAQQKLLGRKVHALLPGLYLEAARRVWPRLVDEFDVLPDDKRGLGWQMYLISRYATPRQVTSDAFPDH